MASIASPEPSALQREREALRSRTDALQMTLMQTQGQGGGLAHESSPAAILQKVGSQRGITHFDSPLPGLQMYPCIRVE